MNQLPTETIDLQDIRLAYCQHGSGPVLLLLHGNSESKRIFKDYQLKHFSMFHTYALDTRGHGQSQSQDDELSFDQISDDVIHFCQARGIQQAAVIGYSDGGNIALFLAHKDPQRFTRLIAVSPNTLVSGTEDATLKLFQRIVSFMHFLERCGINMKKYLLRFNLMLKDIGISDDQLRTIQASMKILYAEKDMIKESHIQHLGQLIPGASLDKIAGSTHLNILSNPQAIESMKQYLLDK